MEMEMEMGNIVTGNNSSSSSSILLPSSILELSPSQEYGIDSTLEILHRVWGCELIEEAGILLKLPQVVMATGQNILHRFFYRKSLHKFDSFTVAMGCILLASKVEEKMKYLRDIIFVFHHMYQKRKDLKYKPLELGGVRYMQWKNELITMERFLLKELGFSFYNILDHPHKYILYYLKMLNGTSELSQVAWNYLNDSQRLDISLRYPAEEIACAAIYMAARKLEFSLPESPPWWSLMVKDKERLLLICNSVLELYHIPKFSWLEPIGDMHYLSPEVCKKYDEPASIAEESMVIMDIAPTLLLNGNTIGNTNGDSIDNTAANTTAIVAKSEDSVVSNSSSISNTVISPKKINIEITVVENKIEVTPVSSSSGINLQEDVNLKHDVNSTSASEIVVTKEKDKENGDYRKDNSDSRYNSERDGRRDRMPERDGSYGYNRDRNPPERGRDRQQYDSRGYNNGYNQDNFRGYNNGMDNRRGGGDDREIRRSRSRDERSHKSHRHRSNEKEKRNEYRGQGGGGQGDNRDRKQYRDSSKLVAGEQRQ